MRLLSRLFGTWSMEVVVLERDDDKLTGWSSNCPPEGTPVRVRQAQGQRGEILVLGTRNLVSGFLWYGVLLTGDLTVQAKVNLHGARREPRYPHRIRVRSPKLPGYKAISTDLNLEGAGLLLRGPVKAGERLKLYLDLENECEPIKVDAIVRWADVAEPYQAGVQFPALTVQQRQTLARYLKISGVQIEAGGFESTNRLALEVKKQEVKPPQPLPPWGELCLLPKGEALEVRVRHSRGETRYEFDEVGDVVGPGRGEVAHIERLTRSPLLLQTRGRVGICLEDERQMVHYRFLGRQKESLLEVVAHEPRRRILTEQVPA